MYEGGGFFAGYLFKIFAAFATDMFLAENLPCRVDILLNLFFRGNLLLLLSGCALNSDLMRCRTPIRVRQPVA